MIFSYIGYVTQEVSVEGKSVLDVSLSEDMEALEEVVVIGYGTMKKSDLTGSLSSVKSEDLTAYAENQSIQQMLSLQPLLPLHHIISLYASERNSEKIRFGLFEDFLSAY